MSGTSANGLALTDYRHWPVGVLYDLLTAKDPSARPNAAHEDEETKLPWNLTLHFRHFPTKHLMSLGSPSACYDAWVNVAKEVRSGSESLPCPDSRVI
jgi:hypothetical protein